MTYSFLKPDGNNGYDEFRFSKQALKQRLKFSVIKEKPLYTSFCDACADLFEANDDQYKKNKESKHFQRIGLCASQPPTQK